MDQNVLIILCVYLTQADQSIAFFNSDKGKQRLTKEGCFRCMIAEAY